MSAFADEAIARMSDEQFLAACERADQLNAPAYDKLRHRADHIRKGGILCRRCAHPIPRLHEDKYRGLFNGEFKPVCSATCAIDGIQEEASRA